MIKENDISEQVLLEINGALATIRLGNPSERMTTLTTRRMESLRTAILQIKAQPEIRGTIVIGANPSVFCAGADIGIIKDVVDSALGRQLATQGQQTFDELAALPGIKVAAISGACVGGGCELALACDYRIVTVLPETKIGLPEIKLGIIPGFGGTQRLARLIGLPKALEIILKGKTVSAARAWAIGLCDLLVRIDETNPTNDDLFVRLENTAAEIALGRTVPVRRRIKIFEKFLTFSSLGRAVVNFKVKRELQRETNGQYPAPVRALAAAVHGLRFGLKSGLEFEARELGELIITPQCKNLVHLYFLSENSSKLGRSARSSLASLSAVVFGGGTMGSGIATVMLEKGFEVVMVEPNEGVQRRSAAYIARVIEDRRSFNQQQRAQLLSRLTFTSSIDEVKRERISNATVIIEAVIEDLKLKKTLLKQIAAVASDRSIIATNTSSLSVSAMSEDISNPERIIGMHFFNPAYKMPLVEIVRGKLTGEKVIVQVAAIASVLGKYPVVVEDVAGFLVNRILSPYLLEAGFLLSEGVSLEMVDRAALNFGMPMGPFRLLDEIGIDVAAKVSQVMVQAYGERMVGPDLFTPMLAEGRLGKKAGMGFYSYDGALPKFDPQLYSILGVAHPKIDTDRNLQITERLVFSMVNEAMRCLGEGVAGKPGKEAAGQIDLASVMGFGFAPFRGGIIRYAQTVGAESIRATLGNLEKEFGSRFKPTSQPLFDVDG